MFLLLLLSTDIHCLLLLCAPLRSQWILANGGEAPWIIVVDLSRSDEKTPWAAIEAIKNGEISSGKYHSTVESFRRPHVVMLANRPADNVGVEMSRDRVVEVEVHRFIEELDGAPTAPTTVAELRTFPGVKTFGDLVPPSPARGPVARQMVAAEDQANADLHREEDEVPPSPARAAVDVAMALGECGPVARQMVAAEEDADDDDDQWVREAEREEDDQYLDDNHTALALATIGHDRHYAQYLQEQERAGGATLVDHDANDDDDDRGWVRESFHAENGI